MNIKENSYINQYKSLICEYSETKDVFLLYDSITLDIKHNVFHIFDNVYTVLCHHSKIYLYWKYKITSFDIQLIHLCLYLIFYKHDTKYMRYAIKQDKNISKKYKNIVRDSNYQLDVLLNKLLEI